MPIDFLTTITLLAFLVGLPITLFFTSNLSERYERKVARVINGLIGSLEHPLQELRSLPVITNHRDEQVQLTPEEGEERVTVTAQPIEQTQYRNHREFMAFIERCLLDKFNDYHDMRMIQSKFESHINKLLFKIPFFMIPGFLFQMGDPFFSLAILSFYLLSMWLFVTLAIIYKDISDINKAYKKYVVEENVFGDYDN
jgi:hypothetical protein